MPTITVDGKTIECQPGQMIIQATKKAGIHIPHFCYHEGLSIVASCRICLVEVEGIPKLIPACQTPVRDGMVVHTLSPKSLANQKQVMEYLLINHPLDCPVCDQAGECKLQDYSYKHGNAVSRFEEDKFKKPKKDVGADILLYNDRCIMCTRCVRFTREVSGTCELYINGRGHKEEIDIFPGKPLDNPLAGNVVDLCPVGALLDKDFLFKQRVWMLASTPSISPVDAGGENILIEHNENVVYRIKPRKNMKVNGWWISDQTRKAYKIIQDASRLTGFHKMQYGTQIPTSLQNALESADALLRQAVKDNGSGSLYAILSPMLACEEAYLLGQYIRSIDPQAVLAMGWAPVEGEDQIFRHHLTGKETYRIRAQKVPNVAGIKRVMAILGGPAVSYDELLAGTTPATKKLKAGWVTAGYHKPWTTKEVQGLFRRGPKVLQDLLASPLAASADVLIPSAAWAEKSGCWENDIGAIQPFSKAVQPPQGAISEGDVLSQLLGQKAYNPAEVRAQMGDDFAIIKETKPIAKNASATLEFQSI